MVGCIFVLSFAHVFISGKLQKITLEDFKTVVNSKFSKLSFSRFVDQETGKCILHEFLSQLMRFEDGYYHLEPCFEHKGDVDPMILESALKNSLNQNPAIFSCSTTYNEEYFRLFVLLHLLRFSGIRNIEIELSANSGKGRIDVILENCSKKTYQVELKYLALEDLDLYQDIEHKTVSVFT